MPRLATPDDALRISAIVSGSPHPVMSPGAISRLMERDDSRIWIDDDDGTVAWWRLRDDERAVELAWLLPREASLAAMFRIVRAGFLDALETWPHARNFAFYGDITAEVKSGTDLGQRAARTWETVFKRDGARFTIERPDARHWRGRIATLREAVEVARKWA
jgi:hypothetical protein